MSTHDEVLDAIDQTLSDYQVSGDAMRWTPEPAAPVAPPSVDFERLQAGFRAIGLVVNAYAKAVGKAVQQIGKAYAKFAHVLGNPSHQRARCRLCSPKANPPRLAINGAEYHRRQKRRSRR